jgi:hypothetical protein
MAVGRRDAIIRDGATVHDDVAARDESGRAVRRARRFVGPSIVLVPVSVLLPVPVPVLVLVLPVLVLILSRSL